MCGHSMGGLVSLDLGIKRPELIDDVILLAPALKFADPMSALTPVLSKVFKYWDSPNAYADDFCKEQNNRNYPFFATESFASLFHAAGDVEKRLKKFNLPLFIVQSKNDTVVSPRVGRIIPQKIKSTDKKVVWFKKSGHEMLLDLEADKVLETIDSHIAEVTGLEKSRKASAKTEKKKASAKK